MDYEGIRKSALTWQGLRWVATGGDVLVVLARNDTETEGFAGDNPHNR